MANKDEVKLENMILRAKHLGITFIDGPATYETINNNKIFNILEDMNDDVFMEKLNKKLEYFESKKYLQILNKHSLLISESDLGKTASIDT
jgi:hypothetical protein